MQMTILKNELQPETKIRACTLSETDETHDITVIQQQISNGYRQKRQMLEQQKSVLVSRYLLQISHVNRSHVPCQYPPIPYLPIGTSMSCM